MLQTADIAPVKCRVNLYEDRIDLGGSGCECSVRTKDIMDVEITDEGFVLDVLNVGEHILCVESGASVHSWERALCRACGDDRKDSDWDGPWSSDKDIRVDASKASLASTRDPHMGNDASTTPGSITQSMPVVTPQQRESPCCLVGTCDQGIIAAQETEHQHETDSGIGGMITRAGGFAGDCRVNRLQLVETFQNFPKLASFLGLLCVSSSSPTLLEGILEEVQASGQEDISWEEFVAYFRNSVPSLHKIQGGDDLELVRVVHHVETTEEDIARPCEFQAVRPPAMATLLQVSNFKVLAWLASLRQQPVHHGLLGLEENGRVIVRYCVLFKDNLDSWEQPLIAAGGQRPRGRIPLSGVRSVAKARDGVILHYRGRLTKLSTIRSEDVDAWYEALQSTVRSSHSPPSPHRVVPGETAKATKTGISINTHKDGQTASDLTHGGALHTPPRRPRIPQKITQP